MLGQVWALGLSDFTWACLWYAPAIIAGWTSEGRTTEVAWIAAAVRLVMPLHPFVWLYFFNLRPTLTRELGAGLDSWRNLVHRSVRTVMWPAALVGVGGKRICHTRLSEVERERRLLTEALAGLLAGEARSWRALQTQVARYVDHRFSGSRAEREDLTADILRTLLENLRRGQLHGTNLRVLNGYIYGIARVKLMHAIRQARHDRVEFPPDGEGAGQLAGGRSPDADVTSRELADKILAAVKTATPDPVRFVVNTHWHGDHTGGNENLVRFDLATSCATRALSRSC